jgi:hypothetical protein
MTRFVFLICIAFALFPSHLMAGSKKSPDVTIRLHAQGDKAVGESFVTEVELNNSKQKIFIQKVPALSERDIKTFYAFPGNDGMIGAYFRLDAHGTNKLFQFTQEEKGRIAVVLINGRIASAIMVQPGSNDGIFYVPGGFMPEEIAHLQKKFPIIGRESEFGKKPATVKKETPH